MAVKVSCTKPCGGRKPTAGGPCKPTGGPTFEMRFK